METSSETERYINGIRVIHYNPTPLESLRFKMTALRVRKRLEKELNMQVVDEKKYQEAVKRLNEILNKVVL